MLGSRVRASLLFHDFLLARPCKRDFQSSRLLRKLFYDFLLARPCKQDFQCSRLLRKFRSRKTAKWLSFFIFIQRVQQKISYLRSKCGNSGSPAKSGGGLLIFLLTNCKQLAVAIFFGRRASRPSQLVTMLGAARTRCAQTSYRLFPSIARLLTLPPNAAL